MEKATLKRSECCGNYIEIRNGMSRWGWTFVLNKSVDYSDDVRKVVCIKSRNALKINKKTSFTQRVNKNSLVLAMIYNTVWSQAVGKFWLSNCCPSNAS